MNFLKLILISLFSFNIFSSDFNENNSDNDDKNLDLIDLDSPQGLYKYIKKEEGYQLTDYLPPELWIYIFNFFADKLLSQALVLMNQGNYCLFIYNTKRLKIKKCLEKKRMTIPPANPLIPIVPRTPFNLRQQNITIRLSISNQMPVIPNPPRNLGPYRQNNYNNQYQIPPINNYPPLGQTMGRMRIDNYIQPRQMMGRIPINNYPPPRQMMRRIPINPPARQEMSQISNSNDSCEIIAIIKKHPNITELDLSLVINLILDFDFINSLTKLLVLDISSCKNIDKINFEKLTSLTKLKLGNIDSSQTKKFSEHISLLTCLKSLDLSTKIPATLNDYKFLTHLNNLTKLNVEGRIIALEESSGTNLFPYLNKEKIEALNLKNCYINLIKINTIVTFSNLKSLRINFREKLDQKSVDELASLTCLTSLDFDNTAMEENISFDNCFKGFSRLRELNISSLNKQNFKDGIYLVPYLIFSCGDKQTQTFFNNLKKRLNNFIFYNYRYNEIGMLDPEEKLIFSLNKIGIKHDEIKIVLKNILDNHYK